jgi:trk system potassium uptake protein TrkA
MSLEKASHSVAIIDKRSDQFRRLGAFGGKTIAGLGFDRDVLVEAGINEAGAFAAVTSGDNSNVLCARIAHETFGIERVVARIYDPRRAIIYQRLGIATVATVAWTTDQVLRRLLPEEQHGEWVDPTGKVSLVERTLPPNWAGKRLSILNEPGKFWITAVTRFGSATVVTTDMVGQEGDVLHFVVSIDQLDALRARLEGSDEVSASTHKGH